MERNLAALVAARGMLTPEHQRLLDHVIAARRAPLPQRVWRIAGLGLYRQDRLSQLGFYGALVLARI